MNRFSRSLRRFAATPLLEALVVVVLSTYVLQGTVPRERPLQIDAVNEELQVEDCIEYGHCLLRLGPTMVGISHGAAHLHLIAVLKTLGFDTDDGVRFTLLMAALALGVLYLAARRHVGPLAALFSLALALGPLRMSGDSSTLWSPAWLPLPASLFTAAALLYLEYPRKRLLIFASLMLGIGLQFHIAFGVLVATLAAMIVLTPRVPRRTHTLLAFGVLLGSVLLSSPVILIEKASFSAETVRAQIDSVNEQAVFLLNLLAVGAALRCWPAFLRGKWEPAERATLLLAATVLPVAAIPLLTSGSNLRYFAACIPGIAILSGLLLEAMVRGAAKRNRVAAIALAGVLAGVFLLSHPFGPKFGVEKSNPAAFVTTDAVHVARYVREELGWGRAEVLRGLRGGTGYVNLALRVMGHLLDHRGLGAVEPGELAVFRTIGARAPADLPSGWRVLKQRDDGALLVHHYQPTLDWNGFQTCLFTETDSDCRWTTSDFVMATTFTDARAEMRLAYSIYQIPGFTGQQNVRTLLLRLPLRLEAGAARVLVVPPAEVDGRCPGAIVGTSGFGNALTTPATVARFSAGDSGAFGHIYLAWDMSFPSGCTLQHNSGPPPPVLEFDEAGFALFERLVGSYEAPRVFTQEIERAIQSGESPQEVLRLTAGHGGSPDLFVPLAYSLAVGVLILALMLGGIAVCVLAAHRRSSGSVSRS